MIFDNVFLSRSIDYTINGFYKNHITVFSEVVPVALELSTLDLNVEPHIGLPADAGRFKIYWVEYLRILLFRKASGGKSTCSKAIPVVYSTCLVYQFGGKMQLFCYIK